MYNKINAATILQAIAARTYFTLLHIKPHLQQKYLFYCSIDFILLHTIPDLQ